MSTATLIKQLERIAAELFQHIVHFLDPVDRICLYLTCHDALELGKRDITWERIFGKYFGRTRYGDVPWTMTERFEFKPGPMTSGFTELLLRLERDIYNNWHICDSCLKLHHGPRPQSDFEKIEYNATIGLGSLYLRTIQASDIPYDTIPCLLSGSSKWELDQICLEDSSHQFLVGRKIDFHCNLDWDDTFLTLSVHRTVRMLVPPRLKTHITKMGNSVILSWDSTPFRCCTHVNFRRLIVPEKIPELDLFSWEMSPGNDKVEIEPNGLEDTWPDLIESGQVTRTDGYICSTCASGYSIAYHNLGPDTGVEIVFDDWNSCMDLEDGKHDDDLVKFCWKPNHDETSGEWPSQTKHDALFATGFIYSSARLIPGTSGKLDGSFEDMRAILCWDAQESNNHTLR